MAGEESHWTGTLQPRVLILRDSESYVSGTVFENQDSLITSFTHFGYQGQEFHWFGTLQSRFHIDGL